MKVADAPRSGWYPDPAGGYGVRWWDGLDWTDARRSLPNPASLEQALVTSASDDTELVDAGAVAAARARRETSEIISQVRDVARSEIDRAGDVISQRAEAAVRSIQPCGCPKFGRGL